MRKLIVTILRAIYSHVGNDLIRRYIIKLLARFDRGGYYYSSTIRELPSKYNGIDIGIGTYGSCFDTTNVSRGVKIGKYCSIAPNVSMYTRDHPYDFISTHPMFYNSCLGYIKSDKVDFSELDIGNDVWIGRNAVVLPSCNHIGDGAVIGAGAVVTHDAPAYAIAVGVPAKVIKFRFSDDIISSLENIKWWNWNRNEILKLYEYLSDLKGFTDAYQDKDLRKTL